MATLERNPVEPGSLGEAEIQEFAEELDTEKPESASRWLKKYLPKVKVIYAFQILFSGKSMKDWNPVHIVQGNIWGALGGILQADYEGFSNLEGYHILWQFHDHVKDLWNMAALSESGKWVAFQMDRGNLEHRKAFLEGRIPEGVKII